MCVIGKLARATEQWMSRVLRTIWNTVLSDAAKCNVASIITIVAAVGMLTAMLTTNSSACGG
jgi:hypothetical protein